MHVEISWVLALKYIESLKSWSLYIKKHRYATHLICNLSLGEKHKKVYNTSSVNRNNNMKNKIYWQFEVYGEFTIKFCW